MLTATEIYFTEENKTGSPVTIFYYSIPYAGHPEKKHVEIFGIDEIARISLNGFSFTLIYKSGGIKKFSVRKEFDFKQLVKLSELRFRNGGLIVIKHFVSLGHEIENPSNK